MWTNEEFWARAHKCWSQYRTQYGFGFSDQAKMPDYQGDLEILAGLKMYRAVSQGGLMVLLGDAKIRQDGTLLMNFGLASGSGPEDQEMIKKLNKQNRDRVPSSPTIQVGSGSVLNDKKWTPLLNDSLILGGAHKRMEFVLALQDFDQFDQARQKVRQSLGPVAPQYSATPVNSPEDYQKKWKLYLINNPEILWNSQVNCPRVFARELIGLKTFGYFPKFDRGQLGFSPGYGAENADFQQYIAALNDAGFPAKNKALVLSSVSEFLFEDAKALN